jgi:hypothetical protein
MDADTLWKARRGRADPPPLGTFIPGSPHRGR